MKQRKSVQKVTLFLCSVILTSTVLTESLTLSRVRAETAGGGTAPRTTTDKLPKIPKKEIPKLEQNTTSKPEVKNAQKVPEAKLQNPASQTPPTSGAELGRLRIRVIDGRSLQPLSGAEVVLIETELRMTTGADGYTPWFNAPIIRNPKYRALVAELHGQLGVISYKNGYRDSIHLGIRMHDNVPNETTVWMYKIGPGDRRIEPVLYEVPYHHIWLIELADRFRQKSQLGEGTERP